MDWAWRRWISSILTSRDGRINRAKYWIGAVILTLVSILGPALAVSAFGVSDTSVRLTVLIAFVLLYPTYALMAKRFHRDKPGWTALYALVPIYGPFPCSSRPRSPIFWVSSANLAPSSHSAVWRFSLCSFCRR